VKPPAKKRGRPPKKPSKRVDEEIKSSKKRKMEINQIDDEVRYTIPSEKPTKMSVADKSLSLAPLPPRSDKTASVSTTKEFGNYAFSTDDKENVENMQIVKKVNSRTSHVKTSSITKPKTPIIEETNYEVPMESVADTSQFNVADDKENPLVQHIRSPFVEGIADDQVISESPVKRESKLHATELFSSIKKKLLDDEDISAEYSAVQVALTNSEMISDNPNIKEIPRQPVGATSADEGSPSPNLIVERSSSFDDDDIISTLMTEIVAMQKHRAKRKSVRTILNIVQNAEVQLLNFVSQWSTFIQYNCCDFDHTYELKLDSILVRLNSLYFNYDELFMNLSNSEKQLENSANQQVNEITSFVMEAKQLLEQRSSEVSSLKQEIESLRKDLLQRCEQLLHVQEKSVESDTTLIQKGKLLKALESI